MAFKQSSERNTSWHLPAINFLWLFYNKTYMLTQKCLLLYIKASREDRHRLLCCLLQLECMLGGSELFTDRSIKIKLMMLFSVMDIKEKKIPHFIQSYSYRISRPIRHTFSPKKCDLNSTCVCAPRVSIISKLKRIEAKQP